MAGSLQQGHRQTGAGPDQVGARRQSRLPPDGLQGRAGQAGEHRGQDVTQLIIMFLRRLFKNSNRIKNFDSLILVIALHRQQ